MLLPRLPRWILAGLFALPLVAPAAPYSPGDLFLGFRATDGTGATKDLLVNLGAAAQFSGTAPVDPAAAANLSAELAATFGSDWATRADLFWGLAGTTGSFAPVGNDPAKTLYATRARLTPGSSTAPWERGSEVSQGTTTSKLNGLANTYRNTAATGSNAALIVQGRTDTNSWASYQPGGTIPNSGPAPGISFAAFNPTVEGNFGAGASASFLDLYRLTPGSGAGEYLGVFAISGSGAVRFFPGSVTGVGLAQGSFALREDEASGQLTLVLTRFGSTAGAASVEVSTTSGSAVAGTDFTALNGAVASFAAGEAQTTVQIPVANRPGFQGDRSFTVALAHPSAGLELLSPSSATVTIQETSAATSGLIGFSSASYAFGSAGGTGGPAILPVTLSRTGATAAPATVQISATGGSLVAGTDFTLAADTTVNFPANASTATVNIPLTGAGAAKAPGTITLALSNPGQGAGLGSTTTATVNVAASGTVSFAQSSYAGAEGQSVLLTVNRSGGSAGAASVKITRTGGTATPGQDYTLAAATTLQWADGDSTPRTVALPLAPDSVSDAAETITLALESPTGLVLGSTSGATVTITDVDTVAPVLALTGPKANAKLTGTTVAITGTVQESGPATVGVRLDGGPVQQATVTGNTFSLNVTPEQGSHLLQVAAVDAAGNVSATLVRAFSFAISRPELAGTYTGLVTAPPGAAATGENAGLLTVTVSATGALTGKLQVLGAVVPFTGTFAQGGEARFGAGSTTSVPLIRAGQPDGTFLGYLSLAVDLQGGRRLTGRLTAGPESTSPVLASIPHADLAFYNGRDRVVPTTLLDPARENGVYTSLFQAGEAPNRGLAAGGYPQGDGYATLTIAKTGVVKAVGKLSDGSALSYSAPLSQGGTWPVYAALYAGRGYLAGEATFAPGAAETDATGSFVWYKPAGLAGQKLYANGWPRGLEVSLVAAKYLAPSLKAGAANSRTVFGPALSAPVPITVTLSSDSFPEPVTATGTIDSTSKVTLLNAPLGLKLSFAPGTGALSGSFTPSGGKLTTLSGTVLQKSELASGFFLQTQPGSTDQTSGLVQVTVNDTP